LAQAILVEAAETRPAATHSQPPSLATMAATQPKKPVGGAYGQFAAERRGEFQKRCEGKPISEIAKMTGVEWKKLSDAQKAPYEKKYTEAKAKYEVDMAAFKAGGGEVQKGAAALRAEKRKAKEGKKAKDPNAPKKPAGGAYGIYLSENREKIMKSLPAGSSKITDCAKECSRLWKELSEVAKQPYEKKYQEKAAAYQKAMEEYRATGAGDEEEGEDDEEEETTPPQKRSRKAGA